MKELGGFAFEGVADELEDPSDDEQRQRVQPQRVEEDAADEKCHRKHDQRDAERVAEPIDGMLVAGRVLRDPLLAGAVAKHALK